jgi:hypothetical protein
MATTKLREFISNIRTGGVMKTSRYSVFMPLPKAMLGTGPSDMKKILMFCSEAQLPGVSLSTSQVRTFGEVREMPYEKLYDNVNLTFYVDQEMKVKSLFDDWMNTIQGNSRTFEYYDNYVTDIQIYVEDARDDSRYVVTLYECYPKMLNPITVGYDTKSEMKLQVSMNYKYWRSQPLAASSKKESGPWDFLSKLPTINNVPIETFVSDLGGFKSNFEKTFPDAQNMFSGVSDFFSGR